MIKLQEMISEFDLSPDTAPGVSTPPRMDVPQGVPPMAGVPLDQTPPRPMANEDASFGSKKLSIEEKKKLLGLVNEFGQFRDALNVAENMKTVAEKIVYIAEMTEKYGLNETDDWFDGVSLDRDMKEITKLAHDINKLSTTVYPKVREMEALYEDIGLKLQRYYDI
jgi:hypothetical protein